MNALTESDLLAMEADADKMKSDLNVKACVHVLTAEVRRLRNPAATKVTNEQASIALAFVNHVADLEGDTPPALEAAYVKAVATIDKFLS